jgi:hypothetical protein
VFLESFYYYEAHQDELTKNHLGDYIAIQGKTVLGYFINRMEGLKAMSAQKRVPGTYIVHKCEPVDAPVLSVTDIDFKVVPAWTH